MPRLPLVIVSTLLLLASATPGSAEATRIDVRVISKGAKFIGSSLGGTEITIRDVHSGELLARGVTHGSTGDTARIMKQQHLHHDPVSSEGSAVYSVELELDEPRQLEFRARGPLAQPQASNVASVTQWVVPGKHITGGDGLLLELPGFNVDLMEPAAHRRWKGAPQTVELVANVTMMCGCPIEPDGLWDANGYEVTALVERNGEPWRRLPLAYAGQTSRFAASLEIDQPGVYQLLVYAYDPANGNTGVDRSSIIITE